MVSMWGFMHNNRPTRHINGWYTTYGCSHNNHYNDDDEYNDDCKYCRGDSFERFKVSQVQRVQHMREINLQQIYFKSVSEIIYKPANAPALYYDVNSKYDFWILQISQVPSKPIDAYNLYRIMFF